ncbi:MAG: hypothetical protein ACOYXT_27750 [Bacteroidota bacterium]
MKKEKAIPFDFVLEELHRADPIVKPMFGCHAVYIQNKIVFILRKKDQAVYDNGVWVATVPEHHQSLRKDFPSLRSIKIFGDGETGWQNIPLESDDFEACVLKACAYVLKGDARIGKIPKPKKKKSPDQKS